MRVTVDGPCDNLCLLTGWYRAISFAANAARVSREEFAPRFGDYA